MAMQQAKLISYKRVLFVVSVFDISHKKSLFLISFLTFHVSDSDLFK